MNHVKRTSSTSINSHKRGSFLGNHNHNNGGGGIMSEKMLIGRSSVRFQRVKIESPEVSVLSNASYFNFKSKKFLLFRR